MIHGHNKITEHKEFLGHAQELAKFAIFAGRLSIKACTAGCDYSLKKASLLNLVSDINSQTYNYRNHS